MLAVVTAATSSGAGHPTGEFDLNMKPENAKKKAQKDIVSFGRS